MDCVDVVNLAAIVIIVLDLVFFRQIHVGFYASATVQALFLFLAPDTKKTMDVAIVMAALALAHLALLLWITRARPQAE